MIYLIGGAPRAGKSTLCQALARKVGCGWMATDVLVDLLRYGGVPSPPERWDADPRAVADVAEWFFPYLERLAWGVGSLSEAYVVEGVHLLPAHALALAEGTRSHSPTRVRSVFLGRSTMSLDDFDRHPGKSPGYALLPADARARFAADVPRWSGFIEAECVLHGTPYVDVASDFAAGIARAEALLIGDSA